MIFFTVSFSRFDPSRTPSSYLSTVLIVGVRADPLRKAHFVGLGRTLRYAPE